jgi:hypothetical protein
MNLPPATIRQATQMLLAWARQTCTAPNRPAAAMLVRQWHRSLTARRPMPQHSAIRLFRRHARGQSDLADAATLTHTLAAARRTFQPH